MGKTASLKYDPNPRSRASKRQSSPSINTDKSLKTAPRASDATPSLLAPRPDGGITKTRHRQRARPKSHAQKVRQEKILSKAEAVMEKMEVKVHGSKKRDRKMRARKATWDEVNGLGKEERKKAIRANSKDEEGQEGDKVGDGWEDIRKNDGADEGESEDSDAEAAAMELKEIREAPVPVAAPTVQLEWTEKLTPIAVGNDEGEGEIT